MKISMDEVMKAMDEEGNINLAWRENITTLPEGLTVGGYLDLTDCKSLTTLPEGLTVGGYLYLTDCKSLTTLPEGLTVGGSLYLTDCKSLTTLPEGLTVGGYLYLRGTAITNGHHYTKLKNGDYVPGKYIYCDNILTHVKRRKKMRNYIFYVGKIKNKNVVSDGENYAHCKNFSEGVQDLIFKAAKDRGAEQYKSLTKDSIVSQEDAIAMYRIITGACRQGTQSFLDSLGELKEKYTIAEIIDLTKGHFGSDTFRRFFEGE